MTDEEREVVEKYDAAFIRAEEIVRSVATFTRHQTIAGYGSAVVWGYVPWRYAEESA